MMDENSRLCGKQEKCKNCLTQTIPFSLFPIYYSNKPYNATEYAKWFTAEYALMKMTSKEIAGVIVSKEFPQMYWKKEKVVLIKKRCHKYDQEWRIVLPIWGEHPISFEYRPYGIILGLHMSPEDKELVYSNGKMAGIKHFYECYIDAKDNLKYRKYRN